MSFEFCPQACRDYSNFQRNIRISKSQSLCRNGRLRISKFKSLHREGQLRIFRSPRVYIVGVFPHIFHIFHHIIPSYFPHVSSDFIKSHRREPGSGDTQISGFPRPKFFSSPISYTYPGLSSQFFFRSRFLGWSVVIMILDLLPGQVLRKDVKCVKITLEFSAKLPCLYIARK